MIEEIQKQLTKLQGKFNQLSDLFFRTHNIDKDIFVNPVYFKRIITAILTATPTQRQIGEFYIKNVNNVRNICFYDGATEYCAPALSSNAVIASGTYTPTLFNTTNVSASTAYVCQYMRVGSVVTVSGKVDIDATLAASADTLLGISLPIASALSAEEQVGGTATSDSLASLSARIKADATNDRASLTFKAIDLNNDTYSFIFSYLII